MNCQQTTELLPAYLDNEINPSERRLIQAHLAGCDACQRDLALLSRTRNRVSQSLNLRAAQAAPTPQALSRLQARLADEALPPHLRLIAWFKRSAPFAFRTQPISQGRLTMKTKFAFSALAVMLAFAATVAFVPSVRAQVAKLLGITTAQSQIDPSFPLPGYLSEFKSGPSAGSVQAGVGESGKTVDIYQDGERFLIFTRSDAPDGGLLPAGEAASVNGQPAVLNTGLTGEYHPDAPEAADQVDQNGQPANLGPTINYTNANKLTWINGDTIYEMLSNLSIEELLKVAAELTSAK